MSAGMVIGFIAGGLAILAGMALLLLAIWRVFVADLYPWCDCVMCGKRNRRSGLYERTDTPT